jgi:PKD repeat protein
VTVADDLHDVLNNTGTADMFRAVSSAQFTSCASYYSPNITPRWDVNFDGTTETVSNTVTISATENGPKTLELKVEAQHPVDGRVARKIIPVTIRNANPVIKDWILSLGPGRRIGTDVPFAIARRPLTVSAIFTDAGRLDHQTASIDWGDGSVSLSQSFDAFTDAFNGVEGRLEARHIYEAAGVYTVRLAVIDADGGVGEVTTTVTVVRPPSAP